MKKIVSLILVALLCAALSVTAFATKDYQYIFDNADLLTDTEEQSLQMQLAEVSNRHDVSVYVLTEESIGYADSWDYAEEIFTTRNWGRGEDRDGILLLVSMEYRDWAIYTSGVGNDAISDGDADYIGETIASYLGDGDYADAFRIYAEECDDYLTTNAEGDPLLFLKIMLVSLGIGAVVALIVTGIMRGQLHSVRSKAGASDYLKPGSLHITEAREFFLYRTVTRRAKPKSSSSGGGGGGSRSGGSSGKF